MINKNYSPITLSFLVGFSSLCIEILWVRLVSFSFMTTPQAFSIVLILFLFGIAAGAMIGKYYCANKKYDLYAVSSIVLSLSAFIDILSLHLLNVNHMYYKIAIMFSLIFLTALLKSIIFPIVHHIGTKNSTTIGQSVANVYFFNIIGSTVGAFSVSFLILAYITTSNAFYMVGIITLIAAIFSFYNASTKKRSLRYIILSISISTILILMPNNDIWYNLIKIGHLNAYKSDAEKKKGFKYTIESQYGVINVAESSNGDVVYGFGVYDGRINTQLENNANKIDRAYRILSFHKKPKKILIIGLSTGSWANVISWIPGVEKIDIIEIDPGYVELIELYPEVSGILNDERVKIHIDDGRRWINRHPKRKYDLIIMNTTFHFRNNSTNLLSSDFFKLVKSKLNTNGVFYFNTTSSPDAFYTVNYVFNQSYKLENFVVASDNFNLISKEKAMQIAGEMKNGKTKIFDLTGKDKLLVEKMLNIPLISYKKYSQTLNRQPELITDNNPISEYKYGLLAQFIDKYFKND